MAGRRARRSGAAGRCLRGLGLIAGSWILASCHQPIDQTRQAGKKATLGDDIYGLFCDRLGAGVLTEDLSGASYKGICHPDAKGRYADHVATSLLPKVSGDKAKRARALSIAKM